MLSVRGRRFLTMKVCTKCRVEKPLTDFGKRASRPDGLNLWCKPCINSQSKAWRQRNPEKSAESVKTWKANNRGKVIAARVRYLYGITFTQRAKMMVAQGQRCAICLRFPSGKSLSVDHCHVTGFVRGMLCDRCNTSIGKFEEDPALLRRAAEYIENPPFWIEPNRGP